jgi:hypothetical protein
VISRARRGARHERGFTVTHLLVSVVALAVLLVVVLLGVAHRSAPTHHTVTQPTVTPGLEPVLRTLNDDLANTVHAIPYDTNGCGHGKGQRALVSFVADGSAPERASWYVELRGGHSVLVHRDCRNGSGRVQQSGIVTEVNGTPIVACTPNCGRFENIRFSYDGPRGLASVVAYRGGAKQ